MDIWTPPSNKYDDKEIKNENERMEKEGVWVSDGFPGTLNYSIQTSCYI